MDKEKQKPLQPEGQQTETNPHYPFKEDAPVREETPEEAAALEQQRKEALTERD
jgi:hypothetical protein